MKYPLGFYRCLVELARSGSLLYVVRGSSTSEGAAKYQIPDDAGAHWEKVGEETADDASTMVCQAYYSLRRHEGIGNNL